MCHVINKANKLDFTQVPNTGEYRVKSTDVQNARDHIWAMAWPNGCNITNRPNVGTSIYSSRN